VTRRFALVPGRMSEATFWANYFARVLRERRLFKLPPLRPEPPRAGDTPPACEGAAATAVSARAGVTASTRVPPSGAGAVAGGAAAASASAAVDGVEAVDVGDAIVPSAIEADDELALVEAEGLDGAWGEAPQLRFERPRLPVWIDTLEIRDLPVGEARIDLALRRHENDVSVNVLRQSAPLQVAVLI